MSKPTHVAHISILAPVRCRLETTRSSAAVYCKLEIRLGAKPVAGRGLRTMRDRAVASDSAVGGPIRDPRQRTSAVSKPAVGMARSVSTATFGPRGWAATRAADAVPYGSVSIETGSHCSASDSHRDVLARHGVHEIAEMLTDGMLLAETVRGVPRPGLSNSAFHYFAINHDVGRRLIRLRGASRLAVQSPPRAAAVLKAASGKASQFRRVPVQAAGTTGRAMHLAISVVRYSIQDTIRLRLPVGEFLWQAWVLLKVTATPALLMAIPFGGIVTVVVSGLVAQVGATALLGAASGVGVLRQGAPVSAGLLMGGAAAAAIASDFGARAIREELDAMKVLGVDPVRRLVVPRFLALLLIAPILTLVIIVSGTGSAYLLSVLVSDVAPGAFGLHSERSQR